MFKMAKITWYIVVSIWVTFSVVRTVIDVQIHNALIDNDFLHLQSYHVVGNELKHLNTELAKITARMEQMELHPAKLAAMKCQVAMMVAASRTSWSKAYRLLRSGAIETCPDGRGRKHLTADE